MFSTASQVFRKFYNAVGRCSRIVLIILSGTNYGEGSVYLAVPISCFAFILVTRKI